MYLFFYSIIYFSEHSFVLLETTNDQQTIDFIILFQPQDCPIGDSYSDQCGKDKDLKTEAIKGCITIKSYPFSKCHDKVRGAEWLA